MEEPDDEPEDVDDPPELPEEAAAVDGAVVLEDEDEDEDEPEPSPEEVELDEELVEDAADFPEPRESVR